jgi:hypothetical protein
MIKSIKVTATKSSNSDIWPLVEMLNGYTGYTVYNNIISSLLQANITEYIASNAFELITQDSKPCYRWIGVPNLNNLLMISSIYVFSSEESFYNNSDLINDIIPIWKPFFVDDQQLEDFYRQNNITVTIEEIDDPDLSDYIAAYAFMESNPELKYHKGLEVILR